MPIAAAYAVCALVWGTTWFALRRSIGPEGFPTFQAGAIRFWIAAAILLALWAVGAARPGPRDRRQFGWICVAGLLNSVSYSLIYSAEQHISGGLAAVLYATFPLATALCAAGTRIERVRATDVLGSLISLGGIAVIFLDRLSVSDAQSIGVLLMIPAVFCSSAYGVVYKRAGQGVHPLSYTGIFLGATAAGLTVMTLLSGEPAPPWPPPSDATIALLYLALIGSVVAFACYFYLLRHITLMTAATLVFVQPLIATVVDSFFEHEVRIGPRTYIGVALTLGGVAVGRWFHLRRSAPPAEAAG